MTTKNSDLSTGPTTPAGKAISSRNAITHACRSNKHIILPGESEAAFDLLLEKYEGEYEPFNELDGQLVNRCAEREWVRNRCEAQLDLVRATLTARSFNPLDWTSEEQLTLERAERYLARADSAWRASWRDIARLRHDRHRDLIDGEKVKHMISRTFDIGMGDDEDEDNKDEDEDNKDPEPNPSPNPPVAKPGVKSPGVDRPGVDRNVRPTQNNLLQPKRL